MNGYLGIIKESGGFDVFGNFLPEVVNFYTEDMEITIYGDYPVSKLVKIAESMDVGGS